ncbi:OsmC family protein [Halocola ammonii]
MTLIAIVKTHNYLINLDWTGNLGQGTQSYKAYNRNHEILTEGKTHKIAGSADPSFLGDNTRYNPEELFVSSLAACHMLWYLHLCSANGIIVTNYRDAATGIMEENKDGSGRFKSVTLRPEVTITDPEKVELAKSLHTEANKKCFIANSCNFEVRHEGVVRVERS